MKNLKIQIRSAQNVGKVWISRKKSSWPHLGPSQAIFSMDPKTLKFANKLPIFLGGPTGPIHPVWAFAAIHPRWGNMFYHFQVQTGEAAAGTAVADAAIVNEAACTKWLYLFPHLG